MKTKTFQVSDLNPAPYNPRKISDAALNGLKKSIERWGCVEPIIVNERTGHVVGGHQRLKAIQASGVEQVDCVIVDLPDAEEKALNVALNNPHIQGQFTEDVATILSELQTELPDLSADFKFDELLAQFTIPASAMGTEFDESCADDVEMLTCPHCQKQFPK